MKSSKITSLNQYMLPNKMTEKLVVAADYNKLKDDFDALRPSDTSIAADTISEVTSAAGVTIDGVLIKDGTMQHAVALSYHFVYMNEAIQQDLTTTFAGPNTAVDPAAYCTAITTGAGGANAITLAAPALVGVVKKIRMDVDAADAVITVSGGTTTTITLNDVGDYVILMGTTAGWRCIENSGCTVA